MELTKYAQAIKNELAVSLEKIGSSLQEFEIALQNLNTGEGMYKVASTTTTLVELVKEAREAKNDAGMLDINKMVNNAAGSIPELAFKASLAGGALGGLTMDDMDASVERLNKSLEREKEKLRLVVRMTNNLKKEHGLA
jgi:hypothetical protein